MKRTLKWISILTLSIVALYFAGVYATGYAIRYGLKNIDQYVKKGLNVQTNVKNVDALHYFSDKELSFPRLTIICKVFMSIFTSEACCERMFSESGHYVTKYRNRLSTINLDQFALNKINFKRINICIN